MAFATPELQAKYTLLPLIICTLGIFASLLGIQFVRVGENGKTGPRTQPRHRSDLYFPVGDDHSAGFLRQIYNIGVLWSTLIGISTGVVIGFTSDYFTSENFKPVLETARVSGSGSAMNIITGFSYGLISIIPSVIGIVIATLGSYYLSEAAGMSGIYGVGIAAVGMLSISGMIVSSDAYGPIVDNARGIAEMAGMPQSVIDTC